MIETTPLKTQAE